MATVGNTATPTAGFVFRGINVQNQCWSTFTMPTPGGWITALQVYFDAEAAVGNGFLVLWDGSGNVLGTIAVNSIPVGSNSAGGQAFHSGTFSTPIYVKGGSTISIGFWMPQSSGFVTSSESGGTSSLNTSAGAPGSQSGSASTGIGALGANGTYTPNLKKIWRSGAWAEDIRMIRRSSVNKPGTPRKIWRGGAWTVVQ